MTNPSAIVLDGARRTFSTERRFAVPPAELWLAVTDPPLLAGWLGVLTREGADFELTLLGEESPIAGSIVAWEPESRLVVTWDFGSQAVSELSAIIAEDGDGSRLQLSHRRLPAVVAASYGAAWEQFLRALGAHLGGPAERPDFSADLSRYRRLEAAAVAASILRTEAGSGIHLERLLDAMLADVWSALTAPDQIGRWLWPVASWPDDPARERPLKAGDEFVLGDPNVDGGQKFSVVALNQSMSIDLLWGAVPLRIELREQSAGTLLVLDQAPMADVFAAGRVRSGPDFAAGWHQLVDQLSLLLSGLTVPEPEKLWDAAHAVYTSRP